MKALLSIFILLFSFCSAAFAYDIVKGPDDDSCIIAFEADLNRDGTKETVTLIKKQESLTDSISYWDAVLKIRKGKRVFTKYLDDMERDDGEIQELVISDKIKPFIVVSYSGGMHAYNVLIYSFNGEEITEELDLLSDGPSVEVKDVDNDGIKELIVKQRDYENHAWEDSYLETYKYLNNKWQLVSVYRTKTKEQIPVKSWLKKGETIYPKDLPKFEHLTPKELKLIQKEVDAGHQPWRSDPSYYAKYFMNAYYPKLDPNEREKLPIDRVELTSKDKRAIVTVNYNGKIHTIILYKAFPSNKDSIWVAEKMYIRLGE